MAIEITATPFADFIAASGAARITVVKNTKNRFMSPYDPAQDYWKSFRDEFIDILQTRRPIGDLHKFIKSGNVHSKKMHNYRRAADGAKKCLGRKKISLLPISAAPWTHGDLTVKVNPEIAALVNGRPYVIKFWLRAGDKVTKNRIDPLLYLLDLTHGSGAANNATVAVLDVVRSNLITPTRMIPNMDALLRGEAASFSTIWPTV